jgi:hypothetical protein
MPAQEAPLQKIWSGLVRVVQMGVTPGSLYANYALYVQRLEDPGVRHLALRCGDLRRLAGREENLVVKGYGLQPVRI